MRQGEAGWGFEVGDWMEWMLVVDCRYASLARLLRVLPGPATAADDSDQWSLARPARASPAGSERDPGQQRAAPTQTSV